MFDRDAIETLIAHELKLHGIGGMVVVSGIHYVPRAIRTLLWEDRTTNTRIVLYFDDGQFNSLPITTSQKLVKDIIKNLDKHVQPTHNSNIEKIAAGTIMGLTI